MNIQLEKDIAEFLNHGSSELYRNEAVNSLMLGLLEGAQSLSLSEPPLLARILGTAGEPASVLVYFRSEPRNLLLTYASEGQLCELADFLFESQEVFNAVVGPRSESERFAQLWSQKTGKVAKLAMGQKIYKLEQVRFPPGIKGEMKEALPVDAPLVSQWVQAFAEESLPNDERTAEHWKKAAEAFIAKKSAHLWFVEGKPVAMATKNRPTRHGVSISGVYTPPEFRRQGYASALVANLSQKMLDQGKIFCVLYTDASNPTSNRIYQQIGYVEVAESAHYIFE